jgi:two-component system response regulator PilR (NtrC family)
MTERNEMAMSHERTTETIRHGDFEFVLSLRRRREVTSKRPRGLVVSSDDEVRRTLAESLYQCGLRSVFSSTVAESRIAMAERELFIVVCNEWLPDGSYVDVAKSVAELCAGIPLVVVSRIGDWPEYLKAVGAGAFDYVAYPPIHGELRRIIRNAVASNAQLLQGAESFDTFRGGLKE